MTRLLSQEQIETMAARPVMTMSPIHPRLMAPDLLYACEAALTPATNFKEIQFDPRCNGCMSVAVNMVENNRDLIYKTVQGVEASLEDIVDVWRIWKGGAKEVEP